MTLYARVSLLMDIAAAGPCCSEDKAIGTGLETEGMNSIYWFIRFIQCLSSKRMKK